MKLTSLVFAASIAASCGGAKEANGPATSKCAGDMDCQAKQQVCVAGVCVPPRTLATEWMLEVTPTIEATPTLDAGSSDPRPASTEVIAIAPGSLADIPSFKVDKQTPVNVTVNYAANVPTPATAHILLSIPAEIPGRPDLTLEVAAAADATGTDLEVPSLRIGQAGALTIAPLSSSDGAKVPPRTFPVILAATVSLDVRADLSIHGKLLNPFGEHLADPFVARVFQQGKSVSNAPTIDEMDGSFLLLVPASIAATPFVVDLEPQATAGPNAWFRSNPMQLTDNVTLPTFNMAPYLKTGNQFRVLVQGDDVGTPAVSGALVRALTVIPPSDATQSDLGSTKFLRSVVTDNDGTANTTLVPGANGNLIYELAVIPPVGSPYATTCLPGQPIGTGGASAMAPSNLPTILLPRRPVLSGTLRDATGTAVANAIVTATPTADPIASCTMTMTRASPGSALTDAYGHFELPLDQGTYQLDYDPPAGSAVPRLSERTAFPISGDVNRTISLPAAAVVEGKVFRPDGNTPLAGATVRIFEPRCASSVGCVTPPWLIAQAQSDANGLFRAVVPGPN